MYAPKQGDLVYLDFNPQAGHEQAGHRPAIVLSKQLFNDWKFAVVCPVTKQAKNYPFEVEIPDGLKISGVILTDQIRSLDWRARNLKVVDHVEELVVAKCFKKIDTFLSLY